MRRHGPSLHHSSLVRSRLLVVSEMIWTRSRNIRKLLTPERLAPGLFQLRRRNDFLGGSGVRLGW